MQCPAQDTSSLFLRPDEINPSRRGSYGRSQDVPLCVFGCREHKMTNLETMNA